MEENHSQPEEPVFPPTPGFFRIRNILRVLLILVVVGVLAAAAITNFISYRQRGVSCVTGSSEVKNGYTSSQAYFSDYPDGQVSLARLVTYGFTQSANVTVDIQAGTMSTLSIAARHNKSTTTYTVDSTGKITKG